MIKLLIGGSPCTYWSVAQKKNREVEAKGLGWELFKNYLIAKEKFKPDFFLYENNKSAAQAIKDQISRELGVELVYINSALVSAQNRQRFYAFNWTIEQPEDRGIYLQDILESGFPFGDTDGKTYCLTANYSKGSTPHQTLGHKKRTLAAEPIVINKRTDGKARVVDAHMAKLENNLVPRVNNPNPAKQQYDCICEIAESTSESKRAYEVKNGQIEVRGIKYPIKLPDGHYITRKLTPTECERLQTLPDGYTAAVCNTQRYRGLGNGWTAEVIIHILNGALKDVPKDEEIIVLSMYDGIGTGRYCLEKMGFANVTYYAYEIDKSAVKVALSNYPDIAEMGDAFALRDDGWELGKRTSWRSR